jgi:C_GCAxxG_C_C family probable redox protein
MSKADIAIKNFDKYNCAQSVLTAYAEDFGLNMNQALQTAVGFGGGMGRVQDVCGAISGAIISLGLASNFKESDGRDKINAVYEKVHRLIDDFTAQKGTIKCRDLLGGCDLTTGEGQKFFKENNLKESCRSYVRLCCELLEPQLKSLF